MTSIPGDRGSHLFRHGVHSKYAMARRLFVEEVDASIFTRYLSVLYWWKLQIVSWILGYVAVEVWRPPPTAPHQQLHVVKMFADDDGASMRTSSPQQQWTWTTSTDQMVVGSPAFLSTGWANLTFSLKAVLWHWRVSLFDHPASWQLPIGWCWIGCFDPGFTWICHGKAKTRMLSPTPCRNLSGERLQSFDMTWHDYVDVLTLPGRWKIQAMSSCPTMSHSSTLTQLLVILKMLPFFFKVAL